MFKFYYLGNFLQFLQAFPGIFPKIHKFRDKFNKWKKHFCEIYVYELYLSSY